MQKFSAWIPYAHRVKAFVSDVQGVKKIVPVPPNQDTINILFKENISSEDEMDAWLNKSRPDLEGKAPANGEEMSLSRVGTHLYEKASSISVPSISFADCNVTFSLELSYKCL